MRLLSRSSRSKQSAARSQRKLFKYSRPSRSSDSWQSGRSASRSPYSAIASAVSPSDSLHCARFSTLADSSCSTVTRASSYRS
ncbi:hypothetical protein [Cohnella rhizosphaerae]|uniref:Uncharacterized protein n=1 Tax=Cohnella rhizosphaerae TaxID=1457232 RepID=A0A9X4QRB5_9BACL|nr:hypothetical protein [Cohnella rhizosphaerae]MDG0808871.1 hypothetical protein [Cohnella rhizosphaerae]